MRRPEQSYNNNNFYAMNIRLNIILETFIHEVFEYKFDFIKKHKIIYYIVF